MRILFLTHSFNSLAQRLCVELSARGHEVSIEFDINDNVAIEAVALGDRSSSPLVGRRIDEVVLPPGTIIGGLVRGDRFLQAHHDSLIERDDHVILFVSNRRHVRDVELLFRVRPTAL